jgi:hypothetical protein
MRFADTTHPSYFYFEDEPGRRSAATHQGRGAAYGGELALIFRQLGVPVHAIAVRTNATGAVDITQTDGPSFRALIIGTYAGQVAEEELLQHFGSLCHGDAEQIKLWAEAGGFTAADLVELKEIAGCAVRMARKEILQLARTMRRQGAGTYRFLN